MRTVARAEPSAVVTAAEGRNATEVGAGADQDQPLGLAGLVAALVGCGIAQVGTIIFDRAGDLSARAMAKEEGLAAPLDRDLLAQLDFAEVELNRSQGQGVACRVHLIDERPGQSSDCAQRRDSGGNMDKVTTIGIFPIGMVFGSCAHNGVGHLKATLF